MKFLNHTLFISCLFTVLSGVSMAQSAPASAPIAPTPPTERMERMRQQMNALQAKNLADLHDQLTLTPTQEVAWRAFAQTLQSAVQAPPRPDPVALEKLSTPERIDKMLAHGAALDAVVQKRLDATQLFYADLSVEQKKIFDTVTFKHMLDVHGRRHFGTGPYWPH